MKAPAECETWTYWWIVKWSGPQPLASIWVWSWDPLRFVRRHPPHHLSPAEQTTRQGVMLWGASATPQPAQQRSDQGRKPVISGQIVAGRAKILEACCRWLSHRMSAVGAGIRLRTDFAATGFAFDQGDRGQDQQSPHRHLCKLVGLPESGGSPAAPVVPWGTLSPCDRGSTRTRLAELRRGRRPHEFNNWTSESLSR